MVIYIKPTSSFIHDFIHIAQVQMYFEVYSVVYWDPH